MRKRIFALALAFVLLCLSLLGCGKGEFDYLDSDMSDYIELSLSDFTGHTFTIGAFDVIDDAAVEREFRREQLKSAVYTDPSALDTYLGNPGYGDGVMIYYDVALEADGQSMFSNLFSKDGAKEVYIGYWEFPDFLDAGSNPLFYVGRSFSDLLEQTTPSARTFSGTVTTADIAIVDFVATYGEEGKEFSRGSEIRIDTASLDSYSKTYGLDFAEAVVGKTIGEKYSFVREESVKTGEAPVAVTYSCVVTHTVKEQYTTIAIDLPADAYDEKWGAEMRALNGKRVYLRFVIDRYIDYSTPEMGADFFVNTLGLKTEQTDPARIREEAFAAMKDIMVNRQLMNNIYPQVYEVMTEHVLSEKNRIKEFPEPLYSNMQSEILEEARTAFVKAKADAEKNGTAFPYKNLDAYAASLYKYSLSKYPTVHDYAKAEAEYQLSYHLLIFAMAELADIRMTNEEADTLCTNFLNYVIEQRTEAYGMEVTAEQVFESYGSEEDFRLYVIWNETRGTVIEYLYENNTWISGEQ